MFRYGMTATLLVSALMVSAAAIAHPLHDLGFERPLSTADLQRAMHRSRTGAQTDQAGSAGRARATPAPPQIRHIRAAVPLKPLSGAMRTRRERYTPIILAEARRQRVDAHLIDAVIQAESAYRADARSPVGASGLMQLMPATAKRFGVRDIWDPEQNIRGGVAYLRFLLERFDGDIPLVLAAYNAGEGAVAKHGNRIPPYPETHEYVRRVMARLG